MRYKISDLAKLLDVSTNTIRRYEEMGYITAERDVNSGYRYYNDDGVFGIINTKFLRKYGFSHEEIDEMMSYNLSETISAYEGRIEEMDKQIAYMTYLRHRMKDDLILIRRAESEREVAEKNSVGFQFILYKKGDELLKEPERLKKVQEFLYDSPEIQRIYLIRKDDIEKDNIRGMCTGWSIKQVHMEKYGISPNEYTESYPAGKAVIGISKLPVLQNQMDMYSQSELKDMLLGRHLKYIKEHGLKVSGDVLAIVITRAVEKDKDMQYMLVSVPVE